MPQKHRVRNWNIYNNALRRRGDLFLYFDENFLKNEWFFKGKRKSGGKLQYSDAVIEMMLQIKNIFRMPLRQAQGFAESIMKRLGLDFSVPNYTTISRRAKTLLIKIKSFKPLDFSQPVHLLIDSTGLSVYSGAYFHRSRYKELRKLRDGKAWKKLHVAFDPLSSEVASAYLSDSTMTDASAVEKLAFIPGKKVGSITADGAYDRASCYRVAHALSAEAIIPPMRTASVQKRTRGHPFEEALATRDRAIHFIKQYQSHEEGLKIWKQENGYHKRSRVEAFMHRLKRAFGSTLGAKSLESMRSEVLTKINILNLHQSLGVAKYELVT